jgi:histone H3/H4
LLSLFLSSLSLSTFFSQFAGDAVLLLFAEKSHSACAKAVGESLERVAELALRMALEAAQVTLKKSDVSLKVKACLLR